MLTALLCHTVPAGSARNSAAGRPAPPASPPRRPPPGCWPPPGISINKNTWHSGSTPKGVPSHSSAHMVLTDREWPHAGSRSTDRVSGNHTWGAGSTASTVRIITLCICSAACRRMDSTVSATPPICAAGRHTLVPASLLHHQNAAAPSCNATRRVQPPRSALKWHSQRYS